MGFSGRAQEKGALKKNCTNRGHKKVAVGANFFQRPLTRVNVRLTLDAFVFSN